MDASQTKELITNVWQQLSTNPMDSKKFLAALGGVAAMLIVFIFSVIVYIINPKDFGAMSGIVMLALPSIAGLVTAYLGGQTAVEVKANQVLQSTQNEKK
jgi:hypothetical protein